MVERMVDVLCAFLLILRFSFIFEQVLVLGTWEESCVPLLLPDYSITYYCIILCIYYLHTYSFNIYVVNNLFCIT